nr:hypothetical protein [Chloroflexia bacterium]
ARKQVTLYTLPEALPRTFDVLAVQTRGGEAVASAEVTIRPLFSVDSLCGVAGYKPGALAALGQVVQAGTTEAISVAAVDLATFPIIPAGLASFDCLVIGSDGTYTAELGPDAQAALDAWVRAGGHLIVATGERWQAALASIPGTLLPADVEGSAPSDDLAGLSVVGGTAPEGEAIVAVTRPRLDQGASVIAADSSGSPLLTRRLVGSGRVDLLAFDPAAPPFANWAEMPAFWSELAGSSPVTNMEGMPPDMNPRELESSPIVGALTQIPALDLPSIKLLAGLLGIYILAVAPLNYFILKRLRRLSWSWVTTLGLVLLFAAASYGIGQAIRGNEVIINRITIVRDGGGADPATARTYVALFSPSKSNYQVRVGGERADQVLLSAMPTSSDPWSPLARLGGGGTVVQGGAAGVRDFGVAQWASRFFMAEHQPASPPSVSADLRFEGDMLRGTVRNDAAAPLQDAYLFLGSQTFPLGNLAPGQEIAIAEKIDFSRRAGAEMGMPLSMLLLGFDGQGMWPGDSDKQFQTRQMILDSVFGYSGGQAVQLSGVNLVAWSQAPGLALEVEGRRATAHDTQLLLTHLPVHWGGGEISIPAGLLAPTLVASEAESTYVTATDIQLYNGWAEFEFTLPPGVTLKSVAEAALHFSNFGKGGPSPPTVAVYDWVARDMLEVDAQANIVNLDDPERFVNLATGVVRVRLTTTGGEGAYTSLGFSLAGTGGEEGT